MSGDSFFARIRGMSITARLVCASLVFLLPIAILSYFLVSASYDDIRLARLEVRGNAYIRPLSTMLQQITEHERLVSLAIAGGIDESRLRNLEKSIDARFEILERIHADMAPVLELDEAGLLRRGKQRLALQALLERWEELKEWKRLSPRASTAKHSGLVHDLMELIALVGGTSRLGLDPDQDSSALVRLVLKRLPATQALVSEVVTHAELALNTGSVSSMTRRKLLLLGAELRRIGYVEVLADGRTALEEDEFYYDESASLQENLTPLLRRYEAAARDFLEYVNMLSDPARWTLVKGPIFMQSAFQLRRTASELSETASAELDVLLERRLAEYRSMLWIIGLSSSGALVVALGLVLLIGRSVVVPIGRLRRFTRRIAQEEFSATLDNHLYGEMAELASDIEAMLATLKRLGFAQGLLDGMTSPCFVVDTKYRLTFVNQPMLDLLEREGSPEEQLGSHVSEFFYKGAKGDILAEHVQSAREAIVNHERELLTDRGNTRFIRLDAVPLYDLEGVLMGSCTIASDLTVVKENEQAVLRQYETMSQVAARAETIADEVASASARLERKMERVTAGADTQKKRTVETVTAMEQMNASVAEVARNAGDAAQEAQEGIGKAEEGERTVDGVIAAIREVQGHADTLRESMRALNQEAEGIGTVMNVIEDIADQTNLLALNAAIEAARAGEAGRGFAVVADEVRKLAEKTMEATKQVGRAVVSIQGSTEKSVQATDNAAGAVRTSTEQAAVAGVALQEIVQVIDSNSVQVRAIATAAEEQAATSEEISRSLSGIDAESDDTLRHADESRQAIERLARLSEDLRRAIREMREE